MMGFIICSVKDAVKLMDHLDEDDMVILTVVDKKTYIHDKPKKIEKKNGEELIKQVDNNFYQDNNFFCTISLYGCWGQKRSLKLSDLPHSTLKILHNHFDDKILHIYL